MAFIDKLAGSMEERTRDSIGRNLEAIFNARKGYGAVVETYGVGSFDEHVTAKPLILALCAEMTEAIRRFEPRLRDPAVRVVKRERHPWWRLEVTGTVDGERCAYGLLFHSIFRDVKLDRAR